MIYIHIPKDNPFLFYLNRVDFTILFATLLLL